MLNYKKKAIILDNGLFFDSMGNSTIKIRPISSSQFKMENKYQDYVSKAASLILVCSSIASIGVTNACARAL